MKLMAIGVCTAIMLAACSRNSDSFRRFAFTPPPPAPTSRIPLRRVRIHAYTLKGTPVTTVVNLPPNISLGANGAVLEARPLWRVPAPASPPPSEYVAPQLSASHGSVFVSTGTNIERIAVGSGHILWRSAQAVVPFTVTSGFIAGTHANTVTVLSKRDGALQWRRPVCPAATRVGAVAVDGQTIFAFCENPAKLVALRAQTGRVLYTRILSASDRGTSLRVLGGGTLLADGFFDGAWMGDNFYLVREHTGDVILKRTNVQLLRVRGNIADFNDRCCFEHSDEYEPAKILPVNLLTGHAGEETTLAPEPARFKNDDGGGSYGPDGTVFTSGENTYLFYGDTLFRYANVKATPTELLRGIVLVVNAHADAFIAVLDGDPDSVLARIDWTAKHAVLHPIAAVESAGANQHAIFPAAVATEVLDGMQLAVFGDGATARFPSDCRPTIAAPATKAQLLAAICESPSNVGYIEVLRVRP